MALWVTSTSDSRFRALLESGDLASGLSTVASSSIVIVPTKRQADALLRMWATHHGTGEPPIIETMAACIRRIGNHLCRGVPALLHEHEVDILIREVITGSSMLSSIGFEAQKLVRWTQYGITPEIVDRNADIAHIDSRKGRILAEIASAWRRLYEMYGGLACDRGRYEMVVQSLVHHLRERPLCTPSGDVIKSCVMIATHGVTTLDRDLLAALAHAGWDVGIGFADDLPAVSGMQSHLGVSVADASWFRAQGWAHGEVQRNLPTYQACSVALASREEEVRRVIACIKHDVQEGVSVRDIAICVPGAAVYRQIIEQLAQHSGLPLEVSTSLPLASQPEATAARAMCDVVIGNWMREDVERLLSHVQVRQKLPNAADVIAVARRERITGGAGAQQWIDRINRMLNDTDSDSTLQHHQQAQAERALEAVGKLLSMLPRAQTQAMRSAEAADLVRRIIDEEHLIDCLDRYTSLAERHQLPKMSFEQHVDNWWMLVQSSGAGTTLKSGVGIAVVSPAELRCRSWKRVYVLGMVEGEFPRLQEHITDREIIPDVLERMYRQAFTDIVWSVEEGGRLVCTRPTKVDGALTLASSLLDELPVAMSSEPPSYLTATERVIISKRDVRNGAKEPHRLDQIVHVDQVKDEKLRPLIEEVLGRPVSASRLDLYSQCPYRYYADRILRLGSIDISDARLSPLERGTMLHEVVAQFFAQQQPIRNYESVASVDDVRALMIRLQPARVDEYWESLQAVAHECMRTKEWTHAYAQIEQDILFGTTLRPGLLRQWLFQEVAYQSTTKHYPAFLELDLDVEIQVRREDHLEAMKVRGRVDRIDVSDSYDRMTFIVNDYKPTVDKKYKLQEIISGTLSQMPIYLEAARLWLMHHNIPAEPWAALYRSFGTSIHKTEEPQNRIAMKDPGFVITKEDPGIKQPDWKGNARVFSLKPLAEQNAEVLAVIGTRARNMRSGEFAVRPLQKACENCSYQELCRIDEWGKG